MKIFNAFIPPTCAALLLAAGALPARADVLYVSDFAGSTVSSYSSSGSYPGPFATNPRGGQPTGLAFDGVANL